MVYGTRRLKIVLAVLVVVVAFYGATLVYTSSESDRRSLDVKAIPAAGDSVAVSLRVVAVNPRTSDVIARLTFRLQGSIAMDPVIPAVGLTLFVNDIHGSQEIVWPRGRRINPIEAYFSLNGNENKYPIDSYDSQIRMLVTRMDRVAHAARPVTPPQEGESAAPPAESEGGLVLTAAEEGERVPIAFSIEASIPGLKFEGKDAGPGQNGFAGFDLVVRRARNVIVVSAIIMVLMMSLAMSVLTMAIGSALGEKLELVPLSLSVSLLFGLPALRNAQPGVPALGAFGDYVSFLWAEQLVAVAAVSLIWTWLLRRQRSVSGYGIGKGAGG
jgi:hypothetical protein